MSPSTTSNSRSQVLAAASEMFGEMRHATEEEAKAYEELLERLGTPIGISVFGDCEGSENDRRE